MTTANLADGTQLNFPDGTDPAVIQKVVKQHIAGGGGSPAPAAPATPEHKPETAAHLAGLTARYGVELLGTAPTGVADIAGAASDNLGALQTQQNRGIVDAVNEAFGNKPKPNAIADQIKGKDNKPVPHAYDHLTGGGLTKKFGEGLDALGFSQFDKVEQEVKDKIDMAAIVLTAGYAGVKQLPKITSKLIETYKGEGVRKAGEVAATAVKDTISKALTPEIDKAKALELAEKRQAGLAAKAAKDRAAIDAALNDPKKPLTTYGKIGETTRQIVGSRLEEGRQARQLLGDQNQKEVIKQATEKEAAGEFLTPSQALAPMKKLAETAENIPGLGDKAKQFVAMLEGASGEKAVVAKPSTILGPDGKPIPAPAPTGAAAVTQGKGTVKFAEAELMRRFLNDVAFGADVEGFPAIFRNAARDAATGLNKDMEAFVPAQAKFREDWARLSQPLNVEGTRLDNLLFGKEGGLRGNAYEKVSNEKIPGRVFGDTASMDVLAETLAGGPNATPQERLKAEKQVEELALQYFQEKARPLNTEALKKMVNAPEMQDIIGKAPSVGAQLGKDIAERTRAEVHSKDLTNREKLLTKSSEEAGKQARLMRAAHDKMQMDIKVADNLLAQPQTKFQQEALTKYRSVLDNAMKSGIITPEKHSAMLTLIGRQVDAQSKAALLKRIAHLGLTIGTGTAAGASVIGAATH